MNMTNMDRGVTKFNTKEWYRILVPQKRNQYVEIGSLDDANK